MCMQHIRSYMFRFFFNVVGFWFPLWISLTNTSLLNCRVIFVRDGGDMWRSFVVDVVALH